MRNNSLPLQGLDTKDMDWDGDTKTGITAPGETLVSSLDFMRYETFVSLLIVLIIRNL